MKTNNNNNNSNRFRTDGGFVDAMFLASILITAFLWIMININLR